MRHQGLDAAVAAHANVGKRVLGICGGLQMLGEALIDLHGVDGNEPGLGLLPLVTLFAREKTVRRMSAHLPALRGAWAACRGWHCRCMRSTMARPIAYRHGSRQDPVADEPFPAWCGKAPKGMCGHVLAWPV